MEFPNSYFYDEVREGFYINGMVKREWAAQIETLQEIDRLCKKYDIQWFADCGTMLGAVRHGGYVPWDDDLDICMLRDDYQRFHKYAVPELPDDFVTLTYETEEYWQMITRITNRAKISYNKEDLKKYHDFPYTAGVDVFVLDYVAPDAQEEEVRRQLVQSVISIGAFADIEDEDLPQEGLELIRMVEEQCKVKLDRKNHLRRQLYQLAERLSCLYPSEGAKEVVLMPYWCSDHNHKYPIEYVNRITQIPFENIMINVPAGYDGALKVEYGDYLQIYRKGGMHDYPLYEMQEDYLLEKLDNGNPFRYTFQTEDLQRDREACPPGIREQMQNFCRMLHDMHTVIRNAAATHPEAVLELLEKCQENAIHIGTQIEEQEGEESVTVRTIETYCEQLYELGEALTQEEHGAFESCMISLNSALERMEDTAAQNLFNRRKIVFLPFRGDLWEGLKPFYEEAAADPKNIVSVIPLPFYDRMADGGVGELHYETEDYPIGLPVMDYREVDIRGLHPDVIYTQNAYDQCNYTYMLPPEFFTAELKKYTEELIYVPYFKIGSFEKEDLKLRKTTDYFVKIPGLIHADKVFVESEQMKALYAEVLAEFCGEETRTIWEEKIVARAFDVSDTGIPKERIPEEWDRLIQKAGGGRKKTVLFLNAVCSMYQEKEKAIQKLRSVLNTFYEHREEVTLIWRPHPSIAGSIHLFERDMWLEYRNIVEEYRQAAWGILDETEDASLAVSLADAYYGDPDAVMQKCRNLGKPVMIQNAEI